MKMDSIRNKLIVFMIAVTIIPMAFSLVVTFTYSRESGKKQAIEENTRLIFQGKTNLENYLAAISRASLAVYNDQNFIRNLSFSVNDYRAIAEIYATLQNLQGSQDDIVQVYFHSYLTNQSTLVTATSPRREIREEPYPGTVSPEHRITYTAPPHQVHGYGFTLSPAIDSSLNVFTFYRSVIRLPKQEQLGLLAIDVRLDGIADIASQLYKAGEEQLYLIDNSGTIIYSSDDARIGQKLEDSSILEEMQQLGEQESGYFDSEDAVHVYTKLDASYADWMLVKRIPHETLYRSSTRLTSMNAVIAVGTMLIVIVGTLLISIRITSPIRKLANYMKQIQAGRMDVQIDLQSRDEIGQLARSFRQMMDRINNLILKEYRLDLANKTNQLKMLQAQINPHFLYNSLQSIGTLALQHNVPRVYSLLSSLANLMRYSMRNGDTQVQLRQELDHLLRFLDLQQERFGEQLRFTTDVDRDSLYASVPKMILQPLAENYFKHGMHPDYGIGELVLTSRMGPDGRLTIVMQNNGAPIPEERLAELRQKLERWDRLTPGEEEESIGLINVLMRLKLYTDETAELTIENLETQGVKVTLSFPAGSAPITALIKENET